MPTTPNQRDTNIQIASEVSTLAGTERDFFVLTGSYSIDALTGVDVKHNDIDANEPRFQPGAPECFKKAAALVLTRCEDTPIGTIRIGRPDTASMIDEYAAEARNR